MAIDDPNCLRVGNRDFGRANTQERRVIFAVQKIVLIWVTYPAMDGSPDIAQRSQKWARDSSKMAVLVTVASQMENQGEK